MDGTAAKWSSEAEDWKTLALAGVLVPATWLLLLGWSLSRSLSGHDGIILHLVAIHELVEAGGDWSRLAYRSGMLGGWKPRDTIGPFPFFSILARAGLAPTAILNATALAAQVGLAFLGTRAAADLASAWRSGPRRLTWVERAASVWLCAFAPYLGWRIGYGHLNLLVGLLPCQAGLALLAAAATGTTSLTLVAVSAAAMVLGLLFTGQQVLLYAVVFGAPVFLGAWLSAGGALRRLAIPVLVTAASFLICLPGFWGMLEHARGSDASRAPGRESVTYSFGTASAGDWLGSLPWTRQSIPADRVESLHHETNAPLGPVLALLLLLPWGRARFVLIGVVAGMLAAVLFSLDLKPFSSALLELVPPLDSFRVPSRAMLPLLALSIPLGIAALLHREPVDARSAPRADLAEGRKRKRKAREERAAPAVVTPATRITIAAIPIAVLLSLTPSLAREAAAWGVVFFTCARRRAELLPAGAALLLLGGASLGGFRERLLPFPDGRALLERAARLGEAVRQAKPELASPLERVRLEFEIPDFAVNTAFTAGLSSLDGYYPPSRRFGSLVFALKDAAYEPTALFFRFTDGDPALAVLRQLYNARWNARLGAPRKGGRSATIEVRSSGAAAGPAWFSGAVVRSADLASLARELRAAGSGLHRQAAEKVWVVSSDPWVAKAPLPAAVEPACAEARVLGVEARLGGQQASLKVRTGADCPLTLATNFAESLRAETTSGAGWRRAAVFPAYGALAAVWVPKGASEVRIDALPPSLPWPALWVAAGALVLAGACALARRTPRAFDVTCRITAGAAKEDPCRSRIPPSA
jgi:hypothetical protein